MKNILYLNPSADIGGAERSLYQMLILLDKKEYQPLVILPQGPLVKDLQDAGIKFHIINRKIIEAHSIFGLLFASLYLAKLVKKYNVTIIHANSKYCCRIALWASFLTGSKLFLHWRDLNIWPDEKRYINWFRRRVNIITVSRAVKNYLCDKNIKARNIDVLYDPIDPKYEKTYSPNKYRSQFSIDKEFVLAITGRIDSWKGHIVLVKALALSGITNLKLLIAGTYHLVNNPSFKVQLEQCIKDNNLTRNIQFIGSRDDMEKVLSVVDVVIVPSDHEPLGMVVLEAMASGKPVIGSDTGGIRETIIDGITGLLFEPGNIQNLAEKIKLLYTDSSLARKLGEAGRKRYLENFNEDIFVKVLNNIYKS